MQAKEGALYFYRYVLCGAILLLVVSAFLYHFLSKTKNNHQNARNEIEALIAQKKYGEAYKKIKKFKVRTKEDQEFICFRKGELYFIQKKFDEVIKLYKDCSNQFKEPTKNSFYLNLLANVYREKGDYKEAVSAYQEAIKLNPQNRAYWVNLINLYIVLGDKEKAHQLTEEALEKNPGDPVLLSLFKKTK